MTAAGEPFFLTMPADRGKSTRRVISRFLKRLARDTFAIDSTVFEPALRPVVRQIFQHLRTLDAGSLLRLIRRPQVHVFLTCGLHALAERNVPVAQRRLESFLCQALYELELDGHLPKEQIAWPTIPPLEELTSPTYGKARSVQQSVPALQFPAEADAKEVPKAFFPIRGNVVLSCLDTNPISDFEAHPDKEGNALSLGDSPVEEWVVALQRSFDTVEQYLPGIRAEMDLVLQQIIPVGTHAEQHLSASYRESIGTIYMTLHPQPMTMTEALIHEFQHNKVNMLFYLDKVMENAHYPLYTSPIRPDPRPLHGILLAAHAFVPVAEMYRRMAESGAPEASMGGFRDRFHTIVKKNSDALDVLCDHAQTTPRGQALIDELVTLNTSHRAYLGI